MVESAQTSPDNSLSTITGFDKSKHPTILSRLPPTCIPDTEPMKLRFHNEQTPGPTKSKSNASGEVGKAIILRSSSVTTQTPVPPLWPVRITPSTKSGSSSTQNEKGPPDSSPASTAERRMLTKFEIPKQPWMSAMLPPSLTPVTSLAKLR